MNDARAENGERKERMRNHSHSVPFSTHGERARERNARSYDVILDVADVILAWNENSSLLDDQSREKSSVFASNKSSNTRIVTSFDTDNKLLSASVTI